MVDSAVITIIITAAGDMLRHRGVLETVSQIDVNLA